MSGILMAIGGAMRLSGPILPEFYRLSGGAEARIVILPTASRMPNSGYDCAEVLSRLGLRRPAQVLPVHSQEDAHNPVFCQLMQDATGLFITGGDQSRLTGALRNTPLYEAILNMFQKGGTVAGTSAGTAALSELMIAYGDSGTLPRANIARFAEGLGLINTCVLDQHFRQRNRIGRLLYAVACYPDLLGIGVDEDTAAVIQDNQLRVIGSSAVTIIDGSSLVRFVQEAAEVLPERPFLSLTGVQMHILTQGGRFHLRDRHANLPVDFPTTEF